MAIIERKYKKGSLGFQVKVRNLEGYWHPVISFKNRIEAETYELELRTLNLKKKPFTSRDARITSFQAFWEVWVIENRQDVSAGWKESQDQMCRSYIMSEIGKMMMADIESMHIGQILRKVKEEHKRSDQTRKHVYSLLRKVFGDAVEYYEMIGKNPVNPKFHRPVVAQAKRNFLKPVESWQLLESCRDHYCGTAVWLETLAALRSEAMIALQWKNIHWHSSQILICRGWKKKEGVLADYPKGKDGEYVPIIPVLRDYLWEKWKACQDPEQFVCQGITGGMLSYNTYHRVLRRLCQDAGVPNVTPHELRHSATELWIQAGASESDIQRLLNHKSSEPTRRYIHHSGDRLNEIGKQVGKPVLTVITNQNRNVPVNVPLREQRDVYHPVAGGGTLN